MLMGRGSVDDEGAKLSVYKMDRKRRCVASHGEV
jgi:hypothetical protein